MNRRDLLSTLASAALVAAWPGLAGAWLRPDPTERILATLRHRRSAAVVGRAYLGRHPGEADAHHLSAALGDDLRCRDCDPARAGRAHMRRTISRQIRDDFANGRVVDVDGWVLSVTEARLCGLAALAA